MNELIAQITKVSLVNLLFPCPHNIFLLDGTAWQCDGGAPHGHVGLWRDEGVAIVPAKIESRHFYDEVLTRLLLRDKLSRAEFSALWNIERAKRLLPKLTQTEYWLSKWDAKLEEALTHVFHNHTDL